METSAHASHRPSTRAQRGLGLAAPPKRVTLEVCTASERMVRPDSDGRSVPQIRGTRHHSSSEPHAAAFLQDTWIGESCGASHCGQGSQNLSGALLGASASHDAHTIRRDAALLPLSLRCRCRVAAVDRACVRVRHRACHTVTRAAAHPRLRSGIHFALNFRAAGGRLGLRPLIRSTCDTGHQGKLTARHTGLRHESPVFRACRATCERQLPQVRCSCK